MSFWNDLFRTKAKDWQFHAFTAGQVAGSTPPRDLVAGKEYINIFIKKGRVVNVRSGLKKFYGAVHSFITLPLRGQAEPGQVTTVTTPPQLKNVDPRHMDNVININHRLLGPLPAPKGDTNVEIGLFSIEEDDLVAPYLGLLENISGVAGVGFIQAATKLIGPITEGINGILHGKGDTMLEIGLATTLNPARTGYFLVLRAPRNVIDAKTLKLDPTDWTVLDADGTPVTDYPYLVLEVYGSAEKFDWARIPELLAQYNLVRDAVRRGEVEEALAGHKVFDRLARTCFDLTNEDAIRLSKEVRTMIDDVLGDGSVHGLEASSSAPPVPEFADIPLYPKAQAQSTTDSRAD